MRKSFLFGGFIFCGLVAGISVSVPCQAATPMQEVKQTTDKILSIVTNPALKTPEKAGERKKLIREAVDEIFDWREMARRTLARHWAARSEAEKKEFTSLFADLLERTYLDRVEGYSGQKVVYEGENVQGDYATVDVQIKSREGRGIPVDYRLKKVEDKWFIYDVVIEGVSLINNYRTQFNSILVNNSFQSLLQKLKAKVSE
jgi:phospholipid transport system substrate-binding protein